MKSCFWTIFTIPYLVCIAYHKSLIFGGKRFIFTNIKRDSLQAPKNNSAHLNDSVFPLLHPERTLEFFFFQVELIVGWYRYEVTKFETFSMFNYFLMTRQNPGML